MSEDEFEHQGRSKKRYENNMKIGCLLAITFWGWTIAIFLYKMFWA